MLQDRITNNYILKVRAVLYYVDLVQRKLMVDDKNLVYLRL